MSHSDGFPPPPRDAPSQPQGQWPQGSPKETYMDMLRKLPSNQPVSHSAVLWPSAPHLVPGWGPYGERPGRGEGKAVVHPRCLI